MAWFVPRALLVIVSLAGLLLLTLGNRYLAAPTPISSPPSPRERGERLQETDPKLLAQFAGTWRGWAVEGKGGETDAKVVHLELRIEGRRIVATQLFEKNPGKSLGEGVFQLGISGKYHTIDATRTSSPGKGQTYLGIYELTGDTWRWCTGNPNKERPMDFVTKRGQFLVILKKHKP